jgi:prevent-host-death family protein
MNKPVNIHEAKTHLSRLLEDVQQGEEVVIAKAGKPLAVLVPYKEDARKMPQRLGFMAGEISVPDDFDDMGADDIAALFGASE